MLVVELGEIINRIKTQKAPVRYKAYSRRNESGEATCTNGVQASCDAAAPLMAQEHGT